MSRWTPKVVLFDDGSVKENDVNPDMVPETEDLAPVVDSVGRMGKTVERITTLQHKMRVAEQSHRDGTKPTLFIFFIFFF